MLNATTLDALDCAMEEAWQQREQWQILGENAGKRISMIVTQKPEIVLADKIEKIARME